MELIRVPLKYFRKDQNRISEGLHTECRRCGLNSWVRRIPLEKEMATHSSIVAWTILWTKEPGEL